MVEIGISEVFHLLIVIMNYIGIFAFAVSGVLKGIEKNMDIFGCSFLGFCTAFGGGMIRDIIAGNVPPLALRNETDFLVALFAVIFAFILYKKITKNTQLLLYFDAIGLGAFCALGGKVALDLDLGPLAVIFACLFTGVGGGMLRDVFAQEIPIIFKKEVYATAVLIGAVFLYVSQFFMLEDLCIFLSALITITLRILAIKFDWHLPKLKL